MSVINEIGRQIAQEVRAATAPEYVPTGIQDCCIVAIGEGKHKHFHVQMPNKVGKTTWWVNLVRHIALPHKNKYFDYPIFHNWPYPKAFGICGTKENLKDGGPIRKEILKWWPRARYEESKAGLHYFSYYKFDTGFEVKLYTSEMDQMQFEGPQFGMWIMDEPGKAWMIGAFNSRMDLGGIGITAFTPIKAGPVIDAVEDMEVAVGGSGDGGLGHLLSDGSP